MEQEYRVEMRMIEGELRPVKVYPMVEPAPDEVTFPPQIAFSRSQRAKIHRQCGPDESFGMSDYIAARQDQA